MRATGLFLLIVASIGISHLAATEPSCRRDRDCPGRKICYQQGCHLLAENESLLRVELKTPAMGAMLYIDDQLAGKIPWEGVVTPGKHQIRIEAPFFESKTLAGISPSGTADTVVVALERARPDDPATTAAEVERESVALPDRIGDAFVGLLGGGGVGGVSTQNIGVLASKTGTAAVMASLRLSELLLGGETLWIDGGLQLGFSSSKLEGFVWGDFQRINIGAVGRVYYPIFHDVLYATGEVEVGAALSVQNHFLFALRGGGAWFLSKLVELRLNLLGFEMAAGTNTFFGYTAMIGLGIRFKKPF